MIPNVRLEGSAWRTWADAVTSCLACLHGIQSGTLNTTWQGVLEEGRLGHSINIPPDEIFRAMAVIMRICPG